MSQARKHRGMKTQALIAQRWRESGLFPHATDAGPGRAGVDILNTPGLAVEVKARGEVSLTGQLKQLLKCRKPGDLRWVIWRHNGQGEAHMDEWTVTMSMRDAEFLLDCARKYLGGAMN